MTGYVLTIETPRAFLPLLQPARYKGAHGGRGSGKSHFFAEALIEKAIMQPGLRWACIREVQKSLEQSVKRLLEDKIVSLGVSHLFDIKQFDISTPGGGVIIFQGMQNHTADSIKSLEGFDGAWVEEAQSLSQRSLELLRPTIRKEYSDGTTSEIWFSWNPREKTDPIDAFLRGDEPYPGSVVVQANFADNPWFPEVLRQEMEYDKRRDPDKYAHVWLGKYRRNSEARVFRNWTVEEFEVDPAAIKRQGADWGFASDPTVLVQCYIVGRKIFVPYEAYRVGCEIVDTPTLFMTIPESEKWPIVADSARPETISHMQKNGFPKIMPAVKGPKSVEEGVEWLQSYDIVVHPRCKHLIDELSLYCYKVDEKTQMVLPILADKDNHVIDALRYSLEGLRRAMKGRPDPSEIAAKLRPDRPLAMNLRPGSDWMGN
jgi:phage terminase large subunit